MKIKIAIGLVFFFSTGINAQPIFQSVGGEKGFSHQYTGGWEYFVGGGVASFDCDGDYFPELFVAGGASVATLFRNRTATRGDPIKLVPETPGELAHEGVTGAYPLDVDSDGVLDLFVLRQGKNLILKGGPDCTFSEFPDIGFVGGNRWTTAFSATWEPERSLPTLAIGNYVDRTDPQGPFEACDDNILLRPGGGRYATTPLVPGHCALSMLFTDWGRRGRQDLRISNDRHYYVGDGEEQMWAMEKQPRLFGVEDGWKSYKIWGMGIASRDISGDGYPEVFLTSMGDQKFQMLDNKGDGPTYVDATYERGTTAHRPYSGDDGRPSTGWHAEFGDLNNDGLDDVFIAKGNVDQMPDSAMDDPNNLLVQNVDGTFREVGKEAGIATVDRSRGAALVDLNLDGLLDIVVVNRRAPVEVYENKTNDPGSWLLLDIEQDGINSQAIGAWVEIKSKTRTWHREITVGGGHASGGATLLHFGLGAAAMVEMRVVWPDGETSHWTPITANRVWKVQRTTEGSTVVSEEF